LVDARHKKLLRYVFGAFWFVLVPIALAFLAVVTLRPADPSAIPEGALDKLRWLVQDQQVPAGIVLFTVFEMVLYHFRHHLPLAAQFGVGGRMDLPRSVRREYEQAAHLLDEAERILRNNRKAVDRGVPSSAREELTGSLTALRASLETTPFDAEKFERDHARASRLVSRHLGRWQKSELREYAESIAIAVAVALLLRAFVVEAFKIPSGSMLPTLQIQDHIFVNKFAYGPTIPFTQVRVWENMPPQRGDVMVFEFPDPNTENPRQDFIKRVIALPGDTLMVDSGHPVINGWKVPNCRVGNYEYREGDESSVKRGELFVEFLGDESYLTLFEEDRADGRQGPYRVKPGEVWVLGDNRNNSSDSRAWFGGRGGGVPFPNMKGRAMFVWLSFGASGNITPDRLLLDVMGKPRLPAGAPSEITSAIEKCVAERPPLSQTTPPPGAGNVPVDSGR
jgi:signal peptidase I